MAGFFPIPDYSDVKNQHLVNSFTGVSMQWLPLILPIAFHTCVFAFE